MLNVKTYCYNSEIVYIFKRIIYLDISSYDFEMKNDPGVLLTGFVSFTHYRL